MDSEYKVFVKGINPNISDDNLKEHFSKYGRIKGIQLIRDKVTGSSKGYAFIEFQDKDSAHKAYKVNNIAS